MLQLITKLKATRATTKTAAKNFANVTLSSSLSFRNLITTTTTTRTGIWNSSLPLLRNHNGVRKCPNGVERGDVILSFALQKRNVGVLALHHQDVYQERGDQENLDSTVHKNQYNTDTNLEPGTKLLPQSEEEAFESHLEANTESNTYADPNSNPISDLVTSTTDPTAITAALASLPFRALLSPYKVSKLIKHHTHPDRCPPGEVHVVYERVLDFFLGLLGGAGGGVAASASAKRLLGGAGLGPTNVNDNVSKHVLHQTLFVLQRIEGRGYVISNRAMGKLLVLVGSIYSPFFVVPSSSSSSSGHPPSSARARARERARAQARRVTGPSGTGMGSGEEDVFRDLSLGVPAHLHPSLPLRLLVELVREKEYTEQDLAGVVRMVRGLAFNPEKGRQVWGVLVEAFRAGRGEEYTPPLVLLPAFVESAVRAGKVEDALRMLMTSSTSEFGFGSDSEACVDSDDKPLTLRQKKIKQETDRMKLVEAYMACLHALRQTCPADTGTYSRVLESLTHVEGTPSSPTATGRTLNVQMRVFEEVTRHLVSLGDWPGAFLVWRSVSSGSRVQGQRAVSAPAPVEAEVVVEEGEEGKEVDVEVGAEERGKDLVQAEKGAGDRMIGVGMYAVLFSIYAKMDRLRAFAPRVGRGRPRHGEENEPKEIPSPRELYRAFHVDLRLGLSSTATTTTIAAGRVYKNTQLLNVLLRAFVLQGDYPGALVVLRHFAERGAARLNHVTYYIVVKALVQRMWYEAGAGRASRVGVSVPLSKANKTSDRPTTWTSRFLGINTQPRLGMKLVNHILWHVSLEEFCVRDRVYPARGRGFCAPPDPQGGVSGGEVGAGKALFGMEAVTMESREDEDGDVEEVHAEGEDVTTTTTSSSSTTTSVSSPRKTKTKYPVPTMHMMEHVQRPRPFGFQYERVPLERLLERATWALREVDVGVDGDGDVKASEDGNGKAEKWLKAVVRKAEKEMAPIFG